MKSLVEQKQALLEAEFSPNPIPTTVTGSPSEMSLITRYLHHLEESSGLTYEKWISAEYMRLTGEKSNA